MSETKPTYDTDVALSLLVQNDIDAQNAIRDWEAYRARNQAVLRAQVPSGKTLATDAGSCGWELRRGQVDYKAMVDHVVTRLREACLIAATREPEDVMTALEGLQDSITEDLEFWRKPHTESFFVRAELRTAPKPEIDLTEQLQASIDRLNGMKEGVA